MALAALWTKRKLLCRDWRTNKATPHNFPVYLQKILLYCSKILGDPSGCPTIFEQSDETSAFCAPELCGIAIIQIRQKRYISAVFAGFVYYFSVVFALVQDFRDDRPPPAPTYRVRPGYFSLCLFPCFLSKALFIFLMLCFPTAYCTIHTAIKIRTKMPK